MRAVRSRRPNHPGRRGTSKQPSGGGGLPLLFNRNFFRRHHVKNTNITDLAVCTDTPPASRLTAGERLVQASLAAALRSVRPPPASTSESAFPLLVLPFLVHAVSGRQKAHVVDNVHRRRLANKAETMLRCRVSLASMDKVQADERPRTKKANGALGRYPRFPVSSSRAGEPWQKRKRPQPPGFVAVLCIPNCPPFSVASKQEPRMLANFIACTFCRGGRFVLFSAYALSRAARPKQRHAISRPLRDAPMPPL